MTESKYLVSEFSLVGKLIDFIIKDGNKIKYLKIDSESQELWIKLSKQLRYQIDREIKPGSWLELKGMQKTYPGVGKVKFKADLVKLIKQGIGNREQGTGKVCIEKTQRFEDCAIARSKAKILICGKSSCWRKGGKEVCQILENSLRDRGLEDRVTIQTTGCLKQCKQAPNLVMMPSKERYSGVKPKQALSILEKYI
jgi:(2Fe-2S) ferredoxin